MINRKKAAMEMSVGTIVTIVLLMTVLIMGLVLVRTIFKSSTENITSIDEAVKDQLRELFVSDNSRKIVILPVRREISLKKGESGGFAFAIRNDEPSTGSFSYDVSIVEIASNCQMTNEAAESLIILGRRSIDDLIIPSGSKLENPVHVNFRIPESASICDIRYGLNVQKDGQAYSPTITVDLFIR